MLIGGVGLADDVWGGRASEGERREEGRGLQRPRGVRTQLCAGRVVVAGEFLWKNIAQLIGGFLGVFFLSNLNEK